MEILNLSEKDMRNSRGGGKSWDHEAIQENLQEGYRKGLEDQEKEQGETVFIGWKLSDIAEEFYDGTLKDLRGLDYTNPNVNRTIRNNLTDAGFQEKSGQEDRKWAVANKTRSDGTVIFKIELHPD